MRYRRPLGLLLVPGDAGTDLARLAGLEGAARAVMVGTVPLAALEALGSKQAVSIVFAAGSAMAVFVTISLARIEQLVPRRFILTAGAVALALAAILFSWGPGWSIPFALGLRAAEGSAFSMSLSLYMMDFIGKADLPKAEGSRAVYLATVWVIGPPIGTWLWSNLWPDAPFVAAILLTGGFTIFHKRLRLLRNPVLMTPNQPVPSPLLAIPRFFRQRYLRIAYAITCLRSVFWATLFIYGPIYVIEAGLAPWVSGLLLSAAAAVLFLGPLVRRGAQRFGVRKLIMGGFVIMTVALIALTAVGDPAPIGVVLWLVGALGAGVIDVLGNIPFMRMVKPRERQAMTGVFTTWREVSFLAAPALAALVLAVAPFWILYGLLALCSVAGIWVTSHLPRRL